MGAGPNLLRLLEPAVRPDGVSTPADRATGPHNRPVEQQSFEELLAGAQMQGAEETADPAAAEAAPASPGTAVSPLGDLARVDRIENASLRGLFGDGQ